MAIHSAVAVDAPSPVSTGRTIRSLLLPIVIILAGLSVLLYPVVATQWNNIKQQEAAQAYSQLESELEPSALAQTLESARSYNDNRVNGPILDPWLSRLTEDNTDYQEYLAELSNLDTMARLVVPTAQVDLPVYHGTSDEVLNKGVGHLFGTDLPVGGQGSHSVLTAHTGMTNATLFDNLTGVKVGDPIYVQVSGEKMKYEVYDTEVVLPHETESLAPVNGEDLLTLITCTPYGVNTHRLLVHAHRVPMDADTQVFEKSGLHWQWWMWALLGLALGTVILLAWWVIRQVRATSAPVNTVADAASE